MKRRLLLVGAVLVSIFLCVNSFNKIRSLRTTSQNVQDEEVRLKKLQLENEALKQELEYKKSEKFVEEQIRNNLGLAKEGEEVFSLPNQVNAGNNPGSVNKKQVPNWKKWRNLIVGKG